MTKPIHVGITQNCVQCRFVEPNTFGVKRKFASAIAFDEFGVQNLVTTVRALTCHDRCISIDQIDRHRNDMVVLFSRKSRTYEMEFEVISGNSVNLKLLMVFCTYTEIFTVHY